MRKSAVEIQNGRLRLTVDGEMIPACAYITYFDERTCCGDFARAGYRLYSVCASFSELPLNSMTGFAPFFGIFETEEPDFSVFDRDIGRVLAVCPDALIFPRVRIAMPKRWIRENPDECCTGPHDAPREALYSSKYREDGAKMLACFMEHVQNSTYADNVIGYQIAGGNTEEWFHFDTAQGPAPCVQEAFDAYLKTRDLPPMRVPELPDPAGTGLVKDPAQLAYLEFLNDSIADTIAFFAREAKAFVKHQQVVGTFYGYVQEVTSPLRGTLALRRLLDCPDLDFFCSPNSYVAGRSLGVDWGEMAPGESLKRHGKLYFLENDIRTYLSDYPENCRPGPGPQWSKNSPVWKGPPTLEGSLSAVRKAFARQLTHGNALWWFDMWGGWYADPVLMEEMTKFRQLMEADLRQRPTQSQVAVFFDERYCCRVSQGDPDFGIQQRFRDAMGVSGVPYDALEAFDWAFCKDYKAVVIPCPQEYESQQLRLLKAHCRAYGVPVVQGRIGENPTGASLREALTACGVHCYCRDDAVVYAGHGYLCVHGGAKGVSAVCLPDSVSCVSVEDGTRFAGVFDPAVEPLGTRIFRLA